MHNITNSKTNLIWQLRRIWIANTSKCIACIQSTPLHLKSSWSQQNSNLSLFYFFITFLRNFFLVNCMTPPPKLRIVLKNSHYIWWVTNSTKKYFYLIFLTDWISFNTLPPKCPLFLLFPAVHCCFELSLLLAVVVIFLCCCSYLMLSSLILLFAIVVVVVVCHCHGHCLKLTSLSLFALVIIVVGSCHHHCCLPSSLSLFPVVILVIVCRHCCHCCLPTLSLLFAVIVFVVSCHLLLSTVDIVLSTSSKMLLLCCFGSGIVILFQFHFS